MCTKVTPSSTTRCGQQITPFGAIEMTNLSSLLVGKSNIYRIDLLTSLCDIWGEWITTKREQLYRMVSGSCSDTELHQYLTYFYLRSSSFNNYVNDAYYFGQIEVPFITRIVQPARKRIDNYKVKVIQGAIKVGGKVIAIDRDFLYIQSVTPIEVEGSERLC